MSDPEIPRSAWFMKQDADGRWFDQCPNCDLFEVVRFDATIERHGQIFTYERQECLSCGWPDYFNDLDPDEWP